MTTHFWQAVNHGIILQYLCWLFFRSKTCLSNFLYVHCFLLYSNKLINIELQRVLSPSAASLNWISVSSFVSVFSVYKEQKMTVTLWSGSWKCFFKNLYLVGAFKIFFVCKIFFTLANLEEQPGAIILQDGRISYEEFAAMMKAGTDWRKASRQYSRERFNSLSLKLMREGSIQLANDGKWTETNWIRNDA